MEQVKNTTGVMGPEELRSRVKDLMDYALVLLKEGHLSQVFFFHTPGRVEILPVPGQLTNDPDVKEAISGFVRERIKAGDVRAVFMVSDVYLSTKMTKEQHDRVIREGLSVEEAAAAGFCEKQEAVLVIGETPLMCAHLAQAYRRPDDDPAHIELVGEAEEKEGNLSGRFSGYWSTATGRIQ